MLELNNAIELLFKGITPKLCELGFTPDYPDGIKAPELPISQNANKTTAMFRGEKGRIKIEHEGEKLSLYCAKADDEAPDDDISRTSLSLLDLETFTEKDIKYICEEYNETFDKMYGTHSQLSGKKMPTPVSRTQAKNGTLAYDANTLGSRFTSIYPELRDEYKSNVEKYGEFLAEDFFVNHGNKLVIETIRENDKTKMRKLFKLLNDIYEDGTNDTQSLVAVTILGSSLAQEPNLAENASEYFGDTMKEPVEQIIKYLGKSKSARMRLENPPLYKPKKEKKKGMMSSMLGLQ